MLHNSLKKSKDFKKVYENGKSYANKYLVMYCYKNDLSFNRIGISVSKKVGNSVIRHRITRLIREAARLNNNLSEGYDLVIIARKEVKDKGYVEVISSYTHLCKLHKLTKRKEIC